MKKPCTFDIANVLMMKSEYGSFLSRVTLMPPYVSEPSSGQYRAHFFCFKLYNVRFIIDWKETFSIAHRFWHTFLYLLNICAHIVMLKSKEIMIVKEFNIYRFRDQEQTLFPSSRFASMTILPHRSFQIIRQKSAIVESRVPIKRILLSKHINMQNRFL